MLTKRQEEVLEIIRTNPLVLQQDLADRLGISRSAVASHIKQLTDLGLIRGRGYFLNDDGYVCVVGGANVDLEGRVPGSLLLGDSNPGTMDRAPGGVGRNIAENLARLGVSTRLITALGRDSDGTWLHDRTAAAGVDLAGSVWSEAARTATYMSIIDGRGEMAVAVNDMAVMGSLDETALDARRETVSQAAAVVVDCNLEAEAVGHVASLARGPLFVDPVSVAKAGRVAAHLASIHTIKPNRAEAAHLSGVAISHASDLEEAAAVLLQKGVQQVVISLGPDGLFFADGDQSGTMSPDTSQVASVTGAGDALMAGLVHAHLSDLPLDEALRFAVAAAMITAASSSPVAADFSHESINNLINKEAL